MKKLTKEQKEIRAMKARLPLAKPPVRKKLEQKTAQQLIKPADDALSKYIRLRDSTFTGTDWVGECISCPRTQIILSGDGKWSQGWDNGHFITRGVYSLRYDEQNCNLQCLTAESNLRMFNGMNKGIAEIKVGDELWAFNEKFTNFKEKAVVEAVKSYMPKDLYEVEMGDGSKFYATGDHRVVSNGKWVFVEDMLHNVSAQDILEL